MQSNGAAGPQIHLICSKTSRAKLTEVLLKTVKKECWNVCHVAHPLQNLPQARGASAPLFGRQGKASRGIKPPLAAASCALNPSNSSTATIPLRRPRGKIASLTLANGLNLPRFSVIWDILGYSGTSWDILGAAASPSRRPARGASLKKYCRCFVGSEAALCQPSCPTQRHENVETARLKPRE